MALSLSTGAAIALAAGSIGSSAIGAGASIYNNSRNQGTWMDNHPLESAIFQAKFSQQLQKEMMAEQYKYNSLLADKQFEMNKYFTEHGHQAETADLRRAGLNPVLSANNGAYSQTGLGSVGLGSATVPDFLQGSSAVSNAKTNRMLAGLQAMDIASSLDVKRSTSALQNAQAGVERAREHNVNMDTDLKSSQIMLNMVEKNIKDLETKIKNKDYDSYDVRLLNELQKTANEIRRNEIYMYEAYTNRISANSNAEYNKRRAGGYSDSVMITPWFKWSHTGDGGKNGKWKSHYEKLPNGQVVEVRSYE